MNAEPAPPLGTRTRIWLGVTSIVTFGVYVALFVYDVQFLHISPLLESALQQIIVAGMAVSMLVFVAKVDRHAMGLTLGPPRETAIETLRQLGILAALAVAFMISSTVIARTTHVRIAVRPGSLEDASRFWEYLVPAVIIGPLHEEVVMRGMLTSALYWPKRKWLTIVASATIFAALHFLMVERPAQYIGLFVIGTLLAWSFLRTRSIVTPFILHATFNLGVLIKDLVVLRDPGFVRRILGYE